MKERGPSKVCFTFYRESDDGITRLIENLIAIPEVDDISVEPGKNDIGFEEEPEDEHFDWPSKTIEERRTKNEALRSRRP